MGLWSWPFPQRPHCRMLVQLSAFLPPNCGKNFSGPGRSSCRSILWWNHDANRRLLLRQVRYEIRYKLTYSGKRTPWYIFGMLTILLCFIPIFHPFRSETPAYEYLYYAIFPGIFNIGWACLQISHMSLVPSLTCSRKRRVNHNRFRTNSITFVIVLLSSLICWFFWLA